MCSILIYEFLGLSDASAIFLFVACARLVALSPVPRTRDSIQNALLGLPTEALSILKVQLSFHLAPNKSPGSLSADRQSS